MTAAASDCPLRENNWAVARRTVSPTRWSTRISAPAAWCFDSGGFDER